METSKFDLDKIKELTHPISELQDISNNINTSFSSLIVNENTLEGLSINPDTITQYKDILKIVKDINQNLTRILNSNVKELQLFREEAINAYKINYKERLKNLKDLQTISKNVGLSLIENKNVSNLMKNPSIISSISLSQWSDMIDSLNQNSLFLSLMNRVKSCFYEQMNKKIERKIKEIPENTDPTLILEFKNALKEDLDLNYSEFIERVTIKSKEQEVGTRENIFKESQEQEKLKKLKEKQEEQRKSYQEYLNLSNKEFERIRRKRKRAKLPELNKEDKEPQEFMISEEVSEKIEKFKSKLDTSFQEKYLMQKDDQQDPLDIIRKRKKEKKEEYQHFIDKIKKKE